MAQQIINIGTLPNDGTGAPLRTAFAETNNNFSQLFAAGLVGSNLSIQNNSILSVNTNGEIRLVPNGIGQVVSNAHIIPNATNIRNLGSTGRRWRSVYTQYADTLYQNIWGNLTVGGNLVVTGNVVTANIATLDVANLTITLAAGATTPAMANGAGILIDGANYAMQYAAATGTMNFNGGIGVDGIVDALYFKGDGGGLVNVNVQVNSTNLTGNTLAPSITTSSLTTVGTLANLLVAGNVQISGQFIGNGAGLTGIPGTSITGTAANAAYANLAAVALTANTAAQSVFASTSNYALAAGHADYANIAGTAIQADNANIALHACQADVANAAILASNALYSNTSLTAVTVTSNAQPNITSLGSLANLTVLGNTITNAIYTNNYYFANGAPFSGSGNGGTGNYGNSNVAAYLPFYSGNIGALDATGIATDNYLYGNGQPVVFGNYGNANVIALMASGLVPFIDTANINTDSLTVQGYSSLTTVGITGNATVGNIFTDGYYWANGIPVNFTGGSNVTIYDQQITPDGTSSSFTLAYAAQTNDVLVSINGDLQAPTVSYTVGGAGNTTITFTAVPLVSDAIDVRFLGSEAVGGLVVADQQFFGNGSTTYALGYPATNSSLVVSVNGIVQTPGAAYNVLGSNIVFLGSPTSTDLIDLRFLVVSSSGTGGNYGDSNVIALLSGVSTSFINNVIPAGNSIFSLGSPSNQWESLYVSGNTIFFNNVPLGTTSNTLTWNGNTVVTAATGSNNIVTSGNITAGNFIGNGALLTNLPVSSTYANANVSLYLASGTNTGNIITTANISGDYIKGNGSQLTGMYGNTNVQSYLPTYTGAIANVSSVVSTGNVTGTYILGNARFMTGLAASYSNANVQSYLPTYTGGLTALTGNVETTANVNGNFFNGNGRFLTGIVSSYGNSNVADYLPTYTGNVNASNVNASGKITAVGNVQGTYILGDLRFSSGLSNVAYTGNYYSLLNLPTIPTTTSNLINDNGFITTSTANVISVNGQTGVVTLSVYTNANVAAYLPTNTVNVGADVVSANSVNTPTITSTGGTTTLANNVVVSGNLTVNGTTTTVHSNVVSIDDLALTVANNAASTVQANGAGLQVGNADFASMLYNSTSNTWNFSVPILANGSFLTSITGSNVTGTVANANYSLAANSAFFSSTANLSALANVVTNNAQPNITSVGTLVNVIATGNITTSANVSANYFLGDGSQLTNMYGNANVANYLPTYTGNVRDISFVGGAAIQGVNSYLKLLGADDTRLGSDLGNVEIWAGSPTKIWNFDENGNITFPDSTVQTTAYTGYGNANVITLLGNLTSNVTTNANVSGSYFIGNGSTLFSITGANVTGNVGNATFAYTANLSALANTVTDNTQPNITSVGNLVSLNVTGNITSNANVTSTGNITSLSNISGANVIATYFIGDGSNIVNLPPGNYSNANVQAYLPTYTGNLDSLTGNVTTTANISGQYFLGNGAFLTGLPSVYGNANVSNYLASGTDTANIITTGNIVAAAITTTGGGSGNISGVNYLLGNAVTVTGNVTSSNVVASYLWGDGSNITNLPGVSYGNANVTTLLSAGITSNVVTTANVSGAYFLGNGSQLTGVVSSYGNANVAAYMPVYTGNIAGIIITPGQPYITSVGQLVSLTVGGLALTNTLQTVGNATIGTNLNSANVRTNVLYANSIVSTNITNKASGQVATGAFVSLNNLKATVPGAGNASLQLATVSGSAQNLVGSEQSVLNGVSGSAAISVAIGASATYVNPSLSLTTAGDLQTVYVVDTTVGVGYRVSLVKGAAALNQITIEQLY